jgi:hypothetical protein
MENEEGKVEVNKLDLGFCLICVLNIILPCGFTKLLGVYKVGNKLIILSNFMIEMNFQNQVLMLW